MVIVLLLQEGDTALIVSARGGDYETVKVLLDNGADPNIHVYQEWVSILHALHVYLIESFTCTLTMCTACSLIHVHVNIITGPVAIAFLY